MKHQRVLGKQFPDNLNDKTSRFVASKVLSKARKFEPAKTKFAPEGEGRSGR